MYKKIPTIVTISIALILLATPALAINKTCLNNNTLQVNTTYYIDTDGTTTDVDVSKNVYCPFGCSNNDCEGSNVAGDMVQMWLTYGSGTVMLVLGVVLGMPYGKIAGKEEDIKRPFNTTLVVKYMFFFIGLFLVYLSFGMARRLGSVYGGESNITDATDTATMVIMITMILFLIIFVVEFVFYVLKRQIETTKERKWGTRENE